jgi:DNA invertase Pin-like site-specific DNA recombinase
MGLATALTRLEAGEAEILLLYRLDRLARDLILQETTIERLKASGVRVVSVTEPEVDSDDHTRVLVRQVLGAIGQYERALIRSRMSAGRAAKKAAGGYAGGRPPFGWRADRGVLIEDEDAQATVQFIVAGRSASPPLSYRELCDRLAAEGHKPPGGRERWHPIAVQRIAERELRRGVRP